MATPTLKTHQDKIVIPEEVYSQPAEIVADQSLTWEEKMTALKNWEMDEKAALVADGENMTAAPATDTVSHATVLKKIQEAERKLEEGNPLPVNPHKENLILTALIAMNIGACIFYRQAVRDSGDAECGTSFLALEKMHGQAVTELIHSLDRSAIGGTEAEQLFRERYGVFEKLRLKGLPELRKGDLAAIERAEEDCFQLMKEKMETSELSAAAKARLSTAITQLDKRKPALNDLAGLAGIE
ncbi:MAG: hypothetical protein ACAH80_14465 [Alphaproteobacteria bacterium]